MRPATQKLLITLLCATTLAACGSATAHQDDIRARSAEVMPFDLDKTVHSFTKSDDGGTQAVVVKDPSDTAQVSLVRAHLRKIRDEFSIGRFDDPVAIHGPDMPGIAALSDGALLFEMVYHEIPGGAEIVYHTAHDPLVGALHDWFDAQVAEHGEDAVLEPSGHVMTQEMWERHHPNEPYPGQNLGE